MSSGLFQDIFVFGDDDIKEYNRKQTGVGGGWWWWKSVIQQKALDRIKENDVLLYLDAGCYFNKFGILEFIKYIELLSHNDGFLGFNSGDANTYEKTYTKRDVFKLLDCDFPEYTDTSQIASGLFFIRKNKLSVKLIDEFVKVSKRDHCLNDTPSIFPNYPEYWSHKNDQSVFSLLVKKIYKDHTIDLITLDYLHINEITYKYSSEVNSVQNAIKSNRANVLRNIKFPIITARIDDDYYK